MMPETKDFIKAAASQVAFLAAKNHNLIEFPPFYISHLFHSLILKMIINKL